MAPLALSPSRPVAFDGGGVPALWPPLPPEPLEPQAARTMTTAAASPIAARDLPVRRASRGAILSPPPGEVRCSGALVCDRPCPLATILSDISEGGAVMEAVLRADHIGSFLRPPELLEAAAETEQGRL